MAIETRVIVSDDLTGEEGARTVKFALDGTNYEIDLSEINEKTLREGFAPFIAAGRKVASAPTTGRTRRVGSRVLGREESGSIRAWARDHGLQVSERSRIPGQLAAAYAVNDPSAAGVLPTRSQMAKTDEVLDDLRARVAEAGPNELAEIRVAMDIATAVLEPAPGEPAPELSKVNGPEWDDVAPNEGDSPQVATARVRKWAKETGVSRSSTPSAATVEKYKEFFKVRMSD
jgi:nucleoid-associated protein Lsr2